jgi:multidrug efflux pump subunit AcrA (membrane-fusion protein)
LDVIALEVKRLDKVTASGAVAGKTLLERKYEQQKQQAMLHAQQQALLLHGLSEEQVEEIQINRTLLKHLTIAVPTEDQMPETGENPVYQVHELKVEKGQQVMAGETLAVLTNHAELFIEGSAFEKDVPLLHRALESDAALKAVVEAGGQQQEILQGLKILYLAGDVDAESRSFHFYVSLTNELLRDRETNGHRFVSWRFRPGQRMQLLVPVQQWQSRIVLPAEAVAQDGAEAYVFQVNGNRLERRAVHVEYRDPYSVVIANDGSLFPGDVVAFSGAQQILLALKNKAGGAIDPHAGHNH